MLAHGAVWRGIVLRGDVVGRALERLSDAEEHWILVAFVVVAVYWYMRSKIR